MLPCLLGNTGATAVSGLITKRNSEGIQIGYIKADEDYYYPVDLRIDGGSYEVDVCAFGCTLIDLEVFKDIEEPYFKDQMCRDKTGKLYQVRSDVGFCRDLRKLNKSIRIDTRVLVGHVGEEEVFYPEKKKLVFQLGTYQKAAEYLLETDQVVDLGCGDCEKLYRLIKPNCMSTIEYDKGNLDLEIKHELDTYDLTICADVIEHITNYKNLLDTIRSTMKNVNSKDGTLIISTPNCDTVGKDITVNEDHVNFWNKESFCGILKEHGFQIIECIEVQEIINYKSIICVCKLKG
jgi:hypothetical protein